MNNMRAAEVLRGLQRSTLRATADEIDEILAVNLAVEADPDDLGMLRWLAGVLVEEANTAVKDPEASTTLATLLAETEEKLKSDWYRIKTAKEEIARTEARRIALRRAIGILRDPATMTRLVKVVDNGSVLAPGAQYVGCAELGSELYALTHKGYRVLDQLEPRLARFGQVSLPSFVHTFDKAESKMLAFSTDIATLAANVGHVKKNRDQVVIGLAKADGAVTDRVAAYQRALGRTNTPDHAVVCTRNATKLGSVDDVARRLREAEKALRSAGYPATPIVLGAAKSLLGFAPEPGLARFKELHRLLQETFGRDETVFKLTARAMSAAGMPAEIVGRVRSAASLLVKIPSTLSRAQNVPATAVALASMVRASDAIADIVARFRRFEAELVRAAISELGTVEADALECVACAGTPEEVVATIRGLIGQLAAGRAPTRTDIAVAVSFAKRFAY